MTLLIPAVLALFVIAYLLFGEQRIAKKKASKHKQSAQDFMNVIIIRDDGIVETKDNYLIGFLSVTGRKTDLLSSREQLGLIDQQTAEVSTVSGAWQILAVSQPADNKGIGTQYTEILDTSSDPIQKKLLREAIRHQNRMLLSGENVERQFYIKMWEPVRDGADADLNSRLNQMRKCFDISGFTCERANREEVIQLTNMIHNPAALIFEPEEIVSGLPEIEERGYAS